MKIYTLNKIQTFPITLEKCWDFFSNPANLELITPAELGLSVISELPDSMYPGMIIHYNVSPILGIKQTWVTEITHIKKPEYFVDEQKIGPYTFWHHQHHFKKIKDDMIETSDIINYSLPFDPFSRIIHNLFISKRLNYIFNYRKKVLSQKFGKI
jgi:ligand-binding SRPBCC domain-containing protein